MLRNYYSKKPHSELLQLPSTLAVVSYNSPCESQEVGVVATGLRALDENTVHEVWSTDIGAISRGVEGRCHWSKTDEVLFASIWITQAECKDIENGTQSAYEEILDLLKTENYPHAFRFWNYLPKINVGDGDQEQYKRFCTGRLKAFTNKNIPADQFPSASALGHHVDGAVIMVFASRILGEHHKNALQVNAYQYPREYGVSSPSFSRATTLVLQQQPLFFVSGTASIVGHKTTSIGDLKGQLKTTADNIEHLLQNADALPLQSMKVYLRHAEDFSVAAEHLKTYFPDVPMIFTHADICRQNLLVEIECFCG